MGGITALVAEDFRQILLFVPRETRADEVRFCLNSSNLWPKIQVKTLRINMRVQLKGNPDAEDFSNLNLQIGNGNSY